MVTQKKAIVSPAHVIEHQKVNMLKGQCLKDAETKLNSMLQNFDDIILKSSGDIGTTTLISMDMAGDISGDSPPVSQRPDIHYHSNTMNG